MKGRGMAVPVVTKILGAPPKAGVRQKAVQRDVGVSRKAPGKK